MADLHQLMTEFLQAPTTEAFGTLRAAVVEDPRWHPYAGDIEALQTLLKEERWAEIAPRFQGAMPSLMLCPEAHLIAAEGARRCDDGQGSALLLHIANTLLRVIPSSAPSAVGGVRITPSRTMNRLAALASAIVPRVLRTTASSAWRSFASRLASTLLR